MESFEALFQTSCSIMVNSKIPSRYSSNMVLNSWLFRGLVFLLQLRLNFFDPFAIELFHVCNGPYYFWFDFLNIPNKRMGNHFLFHSVRKLPRNFHPSYGLSSLSLSRWVGEKHDFTDLSFKPTILLRNPKPLPLCLANRFIAGNASVQIGLNIFSGTGIFLFHRNNVPTKLGLKGDPYVARAFHGEHSCVFKLWCRGGNVPAQTVANRPPLFLVFVPEIALQSSSQSRHHL